MARRRLVASPPCRSPSPGRSSPPSCARPRSAPSSSSDRRCSRPARRGRPAGDARDRARGSGKTTLLAAWPSPASGRARWPGWPWTTPTTIPSASGSTSSPRCARSGPASGTRRSRTCGCAVQLGADVVPSLLNDVAAREETAVLVVDDLHLLTHPDLHASLSLLVDRLPPNLRMVVASRSEPPMPVARMRARGELSELSGGDLHFTDAEAADLVGGVLGRRRGRRRGDPAAANRGLGRGAVPRGAVAARPRGRGRVHRAVRGRQPPPRRLPGRGGAGRPARGAPALPAALIRARPHVGVAVRRGVAVRGRRATARRDPPVEPVPRRPRRERHVVPLSPSLRRAAAPRARAHRAGGSGRAARARGRLARAQRAARRGHRPRARGRGRRPRRRARGRRRNDVFNRGELGTVARWLDALPADAVDAHPGLCTARAWLALDGGRLDDVQRWIEEADRAGLVAGGRGDGRARRRPARRPRLQARAPGRRDRGGRVRPAPRPRRAGVPADGGQPRARGRAPLAR